MKKIITALCVIAVCTGLLALVSTGAKETVGPAVRQEFEKLK